MTQEQLLVRSLLCCLYKVGGSLEISTELFDNLPELQVVFDRDDEKGLVTLSYKSAKLIVGEVDNGVVDVVK